MSRYIEQFDIFFDDTIRYDISISKTIYRYFRYIESSVHVVATNSTSWDKQACTHGTLWRHHYITTSKKYL